MLVDLLIAIVIGGISGWLASIIMKSKSGLVRNVILGIVGGFVGGLLCDLIGISFAGYLGTIVVSVIGACLVIFIVNKFFK